MLLPNGGGGGGTAAAVDDDVTGGGKTRGMGGRPLLLLLLLLENLASCSACLAFRLPNPAVQHGPGALTENLIAPSVAIVVEADDDCTALVAAIRIIILERMGR
jgi:hypothetical protein